MTVRAMLLFCTRCDSGYASIGEIPPRCPACDRVTRWSTAPRVDLPLRPYVLNENDQRFLRSIKIQAD